MSYSVKNHVLKSSTKTIDQVSTTKKGGKMKDIKFLVIHYTAGTSYDGDVKTLSSSNLPVSCHLVIGQDGSVTQIGYLDDKLWHAGRSNYKGLSGLNNYSIGIEVTCPGPVDFVKEENGKKYFRTWSGQVINDDTYSFVKAKHKHGGPEKWWAQFTPAQIEAVLEIGSVLVAAYGLEVVGHDDIAKGRKIDPGPSCPDSVFARLNGRADDDDDVQPVPTGEKYVVFNVKPETLSFRNGPQGDKIGELPEGTIVEKIKITGDWWNVQTPAGFTGWVYGPYLKPYVASEPVVEPKPVTPEPKPVPPVIKKSGMVPIFETANSEKIIGYVNAEQLLAACRERGKVETGKTVRGVHPESLNVRVRPGGKIVTSLTEGTVVNVVSEDETGWVQIDQGWVWGKYLK